MVRIQCTASLMPENEILYRIEIPPDFICCLTCVALVRVSQCAPPVWDTVFIYGTRSDSGRTPSMHKIQACGTSSCTSCADSSHKSCGSPLSHYKLNKISIGHVLSQSNLSILFVPSLFNKLIKFKCVALTFMIACYLSFTFWLLINFKNLQRNAILALQKHDLPRSLVRRWISAKRP